MLLRAKVSRCQSEIEKKLSPSPLAKRLKWGIATGAMTPCLDLSCAVVSLLCLNAALWQRMPAETQSPETPPPPRQPSIPLCGGE